MKERIVNGRWALVVPDEVADWDGPSGDASIPSGWEHQRLASMQRSLRYGDTFMDIGTEHGWLSAIIAREFVGAENMILCEPSPEMWINIEKIWRWNGLAMPIACWPGFLSDHDDNTGFPVLGGWPAVVGDGNKPETPAMPYRKLTEPAGIARATVDALCSDIGVWPKALNIDVEGAELLVLDGAHDLIHDINGCEHIWVSVHPDLMAEFDHDRNDWMRFVNKTASDGFRWEYLGVDHEEHWHGVRDL